MREPRRQLLCFDTLPPLMPLRCMLLILRYCITPLFAEDIALRRRCATMRRCQPPIRATLQLMPPHELYRHAAADAAFAFTLTLRCHEPIRFPLRFVSPLPRHADAALVAAALLRLPKTLLIFAMRFTMPPRCFRRRSFAII